MNNGWKSGRRGKKLTDQWDFLVQVGHFGLTYDNKDLPTEGILISISFWVFLI
jgi:hypothetical protein